MATTQQGHGASGLVPRRQGRNPGTYRFIVVYGFDGTPHVAYETAVRALCMAKIDLPSNEEYHFEDSAVDCKMCRMIYDELTINGFRHWWTRQD